MNSPVPPAQANRRNLLQEEQRQDTRRRIIAAALEAFDQHGFASCPVDRILTLAGVSRAAFYSHFDGKLALACAIAEDFTPRWWPTFEHLGALSSPDLDMLSQWAERHLTFHRDNQQVCSLLSQLIVLEDRIHAITTAQQDAVIAMLAKSHPAFSQALSDPEAHLRASILLWSIDQTCFQMVRGRLLVPADTVTRAIAGQMHAFLTQVASDARRDPRRS